MANKKNFSIYIACDEAQHTCDKSQYNEASFLEKVQLSLHLLFCKACQNYTSKNTKLTKLMKQENKNEGFKNKEKNELEELFKKQIERVENS